MVRSNQLSLMFKVTSACVSVCAGECVHLCLQSDLRYPELCSSSIQTVLYLITPPVYQPGTRDKEGKTPVFCSFHCYPQRELYPDQPSTSGWFLNHRSCSWASFFNLSGVMVPVTQLYFPQHWIRGYFSSLLSIPRLILAGIKGVFLTTEKYIFQPYFANEYIAKSWVRP